MIEKQPRGFIFSKPVPVSLKMGPSRALQGPQDRGVCWEEGAFGQGGGLVPRIGWGDSQFPNPPTHVRDHRSHQPPHILPDNVRKEWGERGLCCTPAAVPTMEGRGLDSPVAPKNGEAPWGGLRGALIAEQGS